MTNEKKLEVIEEAFNYYQDRTSLNNKEEKELLLLVNEIYAAINYTQCCTEFFCEDEDLGYQTEKCKKQCDGCSFIEKRIAK